MMNLDKLSDSPRFDASSIPLFSVIRLPIKLDGSDYKEPKRFVVLAHVNGHAYCLKTTSIVTPYFDDPSKMVGAVFYKKGSTAAFDSDTVVQPDNPFPIPYAEIELAQARGALTVSLLPGDFGDRLCEAVQKSETLKPVPKKRLCGVLGIK